MGHVGDIGRGRGRSGEGTRIGPAPTGERTVIGPMPQAPDAGGAGGAELPASPGPGRGGTGERPVLNGRGPPTEREVPLPTTGSRPALPTESGAPSRTTTGSRPALPTESRAPATFADALTQDQGRPASSVTATLVMPKVEVPVPPGTPRRGKTAPELPTPSSHPAPEGRTVNPMDTPIGRGGGTRITRMPEAPGGRERAGPGEGPGRGMGKGGMESRTGAPRQENDGFGTAPTTGTRPALTDGQGRGPVLPVKQLVPKGLEKLVGQEGVGKKFASDIALLHQQLRPSEMPSSERALRAWAFFTAYAEAAAGHPPTPEGQEVFDKALKEQGFAELRDAHTGEDGLKMAQWVLESSNPEEARERGEQVHLEPPPEVLLSESAQQPEAPKKAPQSEQARPPPEELKKDNAFTQGAERPPLERVEGHSEFVRVSPQLADNPRPVMVPANPERRTDEDVPPWRNKDGTLKKLGGNMLWNVLHRFRAAPEDSAVEQAKWDRMAFGAVLALVAMMLVGIILISL